MEQKKQPDWATSPISDDLTEGEKVQVAVMLEKMNLLQGQLTQVQKAASDLISAIVKLRGLDPANYGINLAAGKILPVAPTGEKS